MDEMTWTDTFRAPHVAHDHTRRRKAESLRRLESLARLLDSAVAVPGTRIRFGLDGVLGLVPGVGDAVTSALSAYLIWEALRSGLPTSKLMRMVGNLAVDATVGAVPVVGDVFDVFWKSNVKNMKILRDHLESDGGVIDMQPVAKR